MARYTNEVLNIFSQLETLPPIHILTTPNVSSVPAIGTINDLYYHEDTKQFFRYNGAKIIPISTDDLFDFIGDYKQSVDDGGGFSRPPLEIRGVNAKIYLDSEATVLTESILDSLIEDGVNFIWLCLGISANSQTGHTLSCAVTTPVFQSWYDMVKAKGFKIGFKPHATYNYSGANYNPTDVTSFLTNYKTIIDTYLACGDTWDYISVSNELEYITVTGNLSGWTTLIDSLRVAYPEAKITAALTYSELSTCGFLSLLDYIGCNFYPRMTTATSFTTDDLINGMFRGLHNDTYIDGFNAVALAQGKKIIITEVGIVPKLEAVVDPSGWSYSTDSESTQSKYYQALFEILGTMENIHGISIWSVTDSFTFIGKAAEGIVKKHWGRI